MPRMLIHYLRAAAPLLIGFAAAAPFAASGQSAEGKVEQLLQAMTLDEKVAMLMGFPFSGPPDPLALAGAGYTPGVPRLGVPPLRFTDGPAGARTPTPATALPAPVSLAATFSTELASSYG